MAASFGPAARDIAVADLYHAVLRSARSWSHGARGGPPAMAGALARHDAIVRGAVGAHGGTVFSTMGDGMAAVFTSARDAVRAVLAAQAGLGAEDWGEVTGPLAARMGLLTAE